MSDIERLLDAIPASDTSYDEWLRVGLALKNEGEPLSTWDNWSRNDPRYHDGECRRKWASFGSSPNPVTIATIAQIAKNHGYSLRPYEGDGVMDWNDTISYDGDNFESVTAPDEWKPADQLIHYLETLFDSDDFVGYVTGDVWQDKDGRWVPSKGVFDRTARQLIDSIRKHPEDLGATIGDWKPEVGAWIRFNPVDGEGVKNENVTAFRYALVESDTMPLSDQDAMYRKLELPIAFLIHSGGKSSHAIVRIDAGDYNEYRQRVEFLYDFLEKNGVAVDKQNRNPSRLSRMPGVTRSGNRQYIVAENIGRKSWTDWLDFVEGVSDELPDVESIFAAKVFDLMGWDKQYRYKMMGKPAICDNEMLFLFKLTDFELFVNGKRAKGYLPGDWRDYFGTPVENHEDSYKINLADGYITTDKT